MAKPILRAGVLGLVGLTSWVTVCSGKLLIERQRQRALSAVAPAMQAGQDDGVTPAVRILAFSSADCRQCHRLQDPALQRVLAARGDAVTVVAIDAPAAPDLVQRYGVLTVPTTVLVDRAGQTRAVNYGFANTQRLLDQVDAILAQAQ
jgi:thioredoxin-like negative regulator of GroEL